MKFRNGATGIDVSFARPPATRVVELGYEFLVGYISMPPASPAKNLSKIDRDGYEAVGLDVPLVFEMSASRANLGALYGTLDGNSAKALAAARNYPTWAPILIADDTNTTGGIIGALAAIGRAIRSVFSSGNIDAQEDYMRAFAAACAPYPIGIYGDTDILERCQDLWVLGWLPNAWAWSGTSRKNAEDKARALGVHVLQRKGFYIDNTWAVDPNEVIKDVEFGPPLIQPNGDNDMATAYLIATGVPGEHIWTPGTEPITFTNPADRDAILKALGIDPASGGTISKEMFDRLSPKPTGAVQGAASPTTFTLSLTGSGEAT